MAVKEAFQGQDDYTWDDFGLVDRPWDDWFADKWEPGGVFQLKTSKEIFPTIGVSANPTITFTADFQPGFIFQSGTVSIPLAFTVSTSGAGGVTRASASTLASIFLQTSSAQVSFEGNAVIPGVFSPQIDAQANVQAIQALMAIESSVTTTITRARILVPNVLEVISKLFEIPLADPFNTLRPLKESRILKAIIETRLATAFSEERLLSAIGETRNKSVEAETRSIDVGAETREKNVLSESRLLKVPVESRIHIINSTNRLNSVIQETKVITVDSENRIIKINRLPFTDSESVIRTRGQ